MALNARVVTLAACRTGLGQYRRGEGVMGMAMALFCAGARAVTVSLWAVDDARTAELIGAYHEAMAGGASPMDALVAAQRAMLGAARKAAGDPGAGRQAMAAAEPYLWAPFILMGQG
jgi:CHAT domain-containing protein